MYVFLFAFYDDTIYLTTKYMDVWLALYPWLSNPVISRTDNFVARVQTNKLDCPVFV